MSPALALHLNVTVDSSIEDIVLEATTVANTLNILVIVRVNITNLIVYPGDDPELLIEAMFEAARTMAGVVRGGQKPPLVIGGLKSGNVDVDDPRTNLPPEKPGEQPGESP